MHILPRHHQCRQAIKSTRIVTMPSTKVNQLVWNIPSHREKHLFRWQSGQWLSVLTVPNVDWKLSPLVVEACLVEPGATISKYIGTLLKSDPLLLHAYWANWSVAEFLGSCDMPRTKAANLENSTDFAQQSKLSGKISSSLPKKLPVDTVTLWIN